MFHLYLFFNLFFILSLLFSLSAWALVIKFEFALESATISGLTHFVLGPDGSPGGVPTHQTQLSNRFVSLFPSGRIRGHAPRQERTS